MLLVQIAYLQRFSNYWRMKFHLISLISIISLFLWVYSHQSWKLPKSYLYIKRSLSSTAITIIQYLIYQILKKIIEKLVYHKITKFLNVNMFIYPLQFGFQHNYSTNHALISLAKTPGKTLIKEKLNVVFL